ncbi:MAG: serine/threonine-protein kinase [Myxococcales bacterium]
MTPVEIERFDEYLVFAKLSEGTTAHVLLGLHQGAAGARKLVVIKRLRAHLARDPREFELFCQEAHLSASLRHPNIVETHKVGIHRGQPFLAMEYLNGQPLARLVRALTGKSQRLSATLSAQIGAAALGALQHVHEGVDYNGQPLGTVHCDVSPHNLLLTYDGQPKLLDFGVARTRTQRHGPEGRSVRGHSAYVAPEQARHEEVDARADVWGVGVALWECLVGRPLFRGDSELAVLRATLTDEIPPVNELAAHVPEALSEIIDRALQRNPERRYPNALEFRQALEGWLASQRVSDPQKALERVMQPVFATDMAARASEIESSLARVDRALAAGPRKEKPAVERRPVSVPPPLPSKRPSAPAPAVPTMEANPRSAPISKPAGIFSAAALGLSGLFSAFGQARRGR